MSVFFQSQTLFDNKESHDQYVLLGSANHFAGYQGVSFASASYGLAGPPSPMAAMRPMAPMAPG